MRMILAAAALLAIASSACAQDHSNHGQITDQPPAATSAASIAGYGAHERAAGLREGRGMGLAMPAERNGYPGPRHVLELADQIQLTAEQRARTQQVFNAMQAEARRLGTELLEQEAELDAIFSQHRATPQLLEEAAARIGGTEAALKVVHLRSHLTMMDILSADQVSRYVSLRRSGGGSGRTRPEGDPPHAEHGH